MNEWTLSAGSWSRVRASRRGRPPQYSRVRGFTLIEVMMSVVLMGIGLALALPSYRDMVEKRQVTNGAEQLASFINSAQGVAMKTNRDVTVRWVHGVDDWCVAAYVPDDYPTNPPPCDCTGIEESEAPCSKIDGQDFFLNQSHVASRVLMTDMGSEGTDSYTFDAERGFSEIWSEDVTFAMRSPSGDFRLNLVVNQVGRVLLCSDDASHAVPGYAVCNTQQSDSTPDTPIIGIDDPIIIEEPIIEDPMPLPEVTL